MYFYLMSYIKFRWLIFLQITHLSSHKIYPPQAPLGSGIDENTSKCSYDFFFVWTSTINVRLLTREQRSLVNRPGEPKLDDEYCNDIVM